MNRMRQLFEKHVPEIGMYVYLDAEDKYLSKITVPSPSKKEAEARMNRRWLEWQRAWEYGQQDPVLTVDDVNDELVNAILDMPFTVKDWQKGVGEVDTRYALSNHFHTRELGVDTVRRVLETYKQLKTGIS